MNAILCTGYNKEKALFKTTPSYRADIPFAKGVDGELIFLSQKIKVR
jgi:hypothetical protein